MRMPFHAVLIAAVLAGSSSVAEERADPEICGALSHNLAEPQGLSRAERVGLQAVNESRCRRRESAQSARGDSDIRAKSRAVLAKCGNAAPNEMQLLLADRGIEIARDGRCWLLPVRPAGSYQELRRRADLWEVETSQPGYDGPPSWPSMTGAEKSDALEAMILSAYTRRAAAELGRD
jgi:hypothetical protein